MQNKKKYIELTCKPVVFNWSAYNELGVFSLLTTMYKEKHIKNI